MEGRRGWLSKRLWFWELQLRVGGSWGLSSAVIPAGRSLGFLSCRLCCAPLMTVDLFSEGRGRYDGVSTVHAYSLTLL